MLRKIVFAVTAFIASAGFALAAVDLNKADQAALDGIRGIGPKTSKSILEERKKGGDFKDWDDFQGRVKGIGGKNSEKLSREGVTINGKSKPGGDAMKGAKLDAKGLKKEAKETKADARPAPNEVMHMPKDVKKDAGK